MHELLRALESEITAALEGLTVEQTQARPSAHQEKWSIQEISEHLLKTYTSTISVLQARVEKQAPTRARATVVQRVLQMFVLHLGRFPNGRRSPDTVTPSPSPTPASGLEIAVDFHKQIAALSAVATRGQALFAKRRCATHQVLGPLSIRQWCAFHLIHGRHHIKQIKAIRADHGF